MRLPFLVALVLPGLLSSPLQAQELTDAELAQRFLRQREAFGAAAQQDLGATRGLELITVDDLSTTPDIARAEPAAKPAGPTVATARPAEGQAVRAEPSPAAPAATVAGDRDTGGSASGVTVAVGGSGSLPGPAASHAPDGTVPVAVRPSAASPTPVVFGRLAPELQVNVRVTFPFDSAVLTDDQTPRLQQLCRVMKGSDIGLFRIVGHTDASGTDTYNERLSLLRAEEVERYFINDCGIAPDRLEAVGFGERFLLDRDDPRAADNRRVEFQALS